MLITAVAAEPGEIAETETGAAVRAGTGRNEFVRRAAGSVAGEVTISYYDPARDYQTGLQRAHRGGPSLRRDRRALPAAIGSGEAKAFAEHRLAALGAGRVGAKLHLGWRRSGIRPGRHVRIEGQAGLWKVERWVLEAMVVHLELVRVPGAVPVVASEPGRAVAEPDVRHGPTTVRLLDLPLYGDSPPERPRLLVAAAGVEAGWRRAELLASYDAGASWQAAGATAAPAVMGAARNALGAAGSALIDTEGAVEVELLNEAMWLEGRNDAALAGGANLALLGGELIQFGLVQPLGARRFRLSRLLRGRFGTEWAAVTHIGGEGFLLLERSALAVLDAPAAAVGSEARLLAIGLEDGDGAAAGCLVSGEALRPPSPVHLHAERLPGGDLALSWVRRSRSGWAWLDTSATPLGEERELYRVTLSGSGFNRTLEVSAPSCVYTATEQAADGAAGAVGLQVIQLGSHAASRAATAILSL